MDALASSPIGARGALYPPRMPEQHIHLLHTVIAGHDRPFCGADDPGPIPIGRGVKVVPCMRCMEIGPQGLPHELTIAFAAAKAREQLRQKLRGMSEADRQTYKEQILTIASASLADPEAAPPLWSDRQLYAALYAIGAIRAGHYQLRRAGVRPTWAILEQGLTEVENVTIALMEGTPL
jgi:hypothetical protein